MPDEAPASGGSGRMARATRAYLAGIGTSGSLLAGAALMFILASALVAFRGWPHVAAQPSPGEVVVSPHPVSAATSPVGRRLAVIAAAAAVPAPGAAPAPGARRGALPGTGRITSPGTSRPIGTSTPTSGTTGVASLPGGGAVPGCSASSCGSGVTTATPGPSALAPAQQVVQQGTAALGNAVAGVGSTASSAVQQTTSSVGGAVGTVSPQAGSTVSSAGAGAAQTIGGTTQTIAGALSGLGQGFKIPK